MEHTETNNARETVNRLLAEIGREHGLTLALNEYNTCAIDMASDVSLILEAPEDRGLVVIYAAIAPLPDDFNARHTMFQEVLRRNLFQPMLGGGSIGLDSDGGMLVYALSASIEGLGAQTFGELLETAYETSVEVRESIGLDSEATPEEHVERKPDVIIRA